VLGTFSNSTYYDKAYQVGPLSDYGKIIRQATANLGNLVYDQSGSRIQSDPANFNANERVYAGYLMNRLGLAS